MSGRVESWSVFETGCPPLNSSKWSPPTRRETKIACGPPALVSSCHTTHGTVGVPGVSVPVATRGFSALAPGLLLSVHFSSAAVLSAHGPKWLVAPEVSSGLTWPWVPAPTDCQWKPPGAVASATSLAANTRSVSLSPMPLGSSSYQVTQPTVSFGPVNAMSGSTPWRDGSTLSVGSPSGFEAPVALAIRRAPTSCQQKLPTLALVPGPAGVVAQAVCGVASFTPLETKICG